MERTPADQAEADQRSPLDRLAHEHRDTDRDDGETRNVEDAVGERVDFEPFNGRSARLRRPEVMPLEKLMEDESVDEPAEAKAQDGVATFCSRQTHRATKAALREVVKRSRVDVP